MILRLQATVILAWLLGRTVLGFHRTTWAAFVSGISGIWR